MGEENETNTTAASTDGGTANGAGQQAGSSSVQFTPEQQARLDHIIAERLQRAKEKWDAAAAAAQRQAEQEAEAARLAEQQKWQELAQKRAAEVKELQAALEVGQAREGRLTRLEAALTTVAQVQRQGLPAHLLLLLDKMPVEEQLEYLAANAAVLRPGGQQQALIPPTPPAQGAPGLTEEQRREMSAHPRAYGW